MILPPEVGVVCVAQPLERGSAIMQLAQSFAHRLAPVGRSLEAILNHAARQPPSQPQALVDYLLGPQPRPNVGLTAEARMFGCQEKWLQTTLWQNAAAVYGVSKALAGDLFLRLLTQFRSGGLKSIAVLSVTAFDKAPFDFRP